MHPMRDAHYHSLSPEGFHRIAYYEWGAKDRPVVICAHGLTRNGRDFDRLAAALSEHWRVVCPDIVGRGRSDWLANPHHYSYPQYLADMTALIARLQVEDVTWIGTSMGGLIGMMLAALPKTPICRLVMNDIGARVPAEGLKRLAGYVGKAPHFATLADLKTYLKSIYPSYGIQAEADWDHLAIWGHRILQDGQLSLAYDPRIGDGFGDSSKIEEINLESVWNMVSCPVLLLRGAESDLFPADVAGTMRYGRDKVSFHEFPGIGHAPTLMTDDQIAVLRNWL